MLIFHEKEKAYNAIKYFYENTMTCEKKKLFKLLFLLDFEHFEQTGRTVTGYHYHAWMRGPVPMELYRDIKNHSTDLTNEFNFEDGPSDYDSLCLVSKTPFDPEVFSRRELSLLADIADRFRDSTGNEMEDFTHREGSPWQRVYEVEARQNQQIPFEYQLDGLDEGKKEVLLDISRDRASIIAHYQ